MNSRFKFVQSVNPQPIPTNAVKPKFSKLTLATSKFVAIETVNEQKNPNLKSSKTVTCTTTTTTKTRTTMTKMISEPAPETPTVSSLQQQKLLLYESTKEETQSNILTDDDTDSINSSIDSKELEAGMKEISQPTQDFVKNIDRIDTQMQNLSVMSPLNQTDKSDASIQNMSLQLDQLSIHHNQNDKVEENLVSPDRRSIESVQTLSSNDTIDQNPVEFEDTEDKAKKSDEESVIVLSDTDSEESEAEPEPEPKPKRNISQEPPLKPTFPSSNDPAMYNISSVDSSSMQKVNHFFDNAPFIEPENPIENSFNSSHMSEAIHDDVYVPETTDEESIANESSFGGEIGQQKESELIVQQPPANVQREQSKFSDNNIIVDIPVIKSSSDQPRQVIRSQSGVRLTGSRSSPVIKTATATIDKDGIKRTSSNVVLTPGNCGLRFNSGNGQVTVAAKININIQIVEDSSEDSSEDNKPTQSSQAIQSSEDVSNERNGKKNAEPNSEKSRTPKVRRTPDKSHTPKNTRTPTNHGKSDAVDTPTKTPQSVARLKQFEFVPPKSMTKPKNAGSDAEPMANNKQLDNSMTTESSENDGFQVDKNIPINPRDQKLLHKVYGDAWKTPEVIRSYSAIKGKPLVDRAITKTAPPKLKDYRHSKGFDLFKQKLKTNLNSTRFDDLAELSMIEAPNGAVEINTPARGIKPPQNTPRSRIKPAPSTKNVLQNEPSQSVLTKKKPTPKLDANRNSPTSSTSSQRPQRKARAKRIIYSDDESDKENESDWSDDSSYSGSDSEADLLTEDESEEDGAKRNRKNKNTATKPKVMRGQKATPGPTKRPTKKSDKNKLIYLDLSSEEIVQVDENFKPNVSEEDLANITKRFLEADLNDDDKPKKKTGRKLFTQQYNESDDDNDTFYEAEPRSVKKKPIEEPSLDIEIPRFTHKLFDSKQFGSPSLNKTPASKCNVKFDEFKTPTISKILAERQTPFGSAKSQLDSPPKTFVTYGFLKSLDVEASMMLCHPDAKKFRQNFKSHKEELTTILFKMFNEKVFNNKLNIDIVWNKKLTTTAGRFQGLSKSRLLKGQNHFVELSEKVLTSADRLRCTLIHELCHAATFIFDNEKGHGACWKSWAKRSNQAFPELPAITTCHNYDIEYKYTYKCDMCHNKSYSHSKSKKVENIRCSYCHGMISIYLNKRKDGKIVMEPVREATGFAKFVKEKYKDFKKPGVTHAEVMRQISSQYSTLSQEEKKQY